jgi:hypothetical protein
MAYFIIIFIPLINGILIAYLSQIVTHDVGNRFIFAILAASASYIAVPAAMKIAVPKANPGLSTNGISSYFPFQYNLWNAYLPIYNFKFIKTNYK